MNSRRTMTTVTLLVLTALLCLGGYVGWKTLTSPVDGDPVAGEPTPSPSCNDGLNPGDLVRTRDVTVSVYNAGTRPGLAEQTQNELVARGFIAGEISNAPEDSQVRFARVRAPSADDPAARLVALQFGPNTLIEETEDDLGPGVDVIVGDAAKGLVKAPKKLRAEASGSGC